MNILISIVVFFILYVFLLLNKLDKYDKLAIKYYLYELDFRDHLISLNNSKGISIFNKIKYLWKYFIIPFRDPIYFYKYTLGLIYTKYSLKYTSFSRNKLLWIDIFKKYNINHPKLIAYNHNDQIKYFENIDESMEYVVKPIYGFLGVNVKKIKGNQIEDFLKNNKDFFIQQKLFDCVKNNYRFFRFVSSFKGNKLILIEYSSDKSFVPNVSHGGTKKMCLNLKCDSLSGNKIVNEKMDKMMNDLANLHKKEFPNVISIGWDLMINCEDSSDKIKIYCLEGNAPHIAWDENSGPEFDETILKYKQEFKDFLNNR